MKRRIPLFLLALLLLVSALPMGAGAAFNFGRGTPTILITLEDTIQENCYVTLLAQEDSSGPWVAVDTFAQSYQPEKADQEIWELFNSYQDPDGFHFLGFYQDCTLSQGFLWNYCPPETFKVLILYPDSGSFAVSQETYQRYAYDSHFSATVSGGQVTLTQTSTAVSQVLNLVIRTVLMLAVALLIAKLFRLGGKQIPYLAGVHGGILLVLNLFLTLVNYRSGSSLFLMDALLLTIVVVMVEWKLFGTGLPKRAADPEAPCPVRKLTLVANVVGMVVNVLAFLLLSVFL